jgi:dinuclear metal center YbgI/SA1388 family protein
MTSIDLVSYLNKLLRVSEIEDGSKNGLQVEGVKNIARMAFAVDACQASFENAAVAGAQLLVVHHGIFWDKPLVLTGPHFRRIKTLLSSNVGVYAAHLPLDMHPVFGNNAELARVLGLCRCQPFGKYHKNVIGLAGTLSKPLTLKDLSDRLSRATGWPVVSILDFGPKRVRKVACISGGAAGMIDQVEAAGCDTYVTGEASHGAFHEASERKLNVIFGGHYATEVLGLKALARHLEKKFKLSTVFLDLPTGA